MDELLHEYFELEEEVAGIARNLNTRHGFNIHQWELCHFYLAQDRLAAMVAKLRDVYEVDVSEFELQF